MSAGKSDSDQEKLFSIELLTIQQVADWAKVSPKTIYRWIETGQIPVVKFGNRTYRIPAGAVIARANRHAGWVITLHTWAGNELSLYVWIHAYFFFQHRAIHHPRREFVLSHASDRTSMTTHAFAQIDHHHPAAILGRLFQRALKFFVHADENIFWFLCHREASIKKFSD